MRESEYHRAYIHQVLMAIINATPRRPSIIGMAIGAALLVLGVYMLYQQWEQLKQLLFIFGGFFLLLFGLGIFTASAARR